MLTARQVIERLLGNQRTFPQRAQAGSFVMRNLIDPKDVLEWSELERIVNTTGAPRTLIRDGSYIHSPKSGQINELIPQGYSLQIEHAEQFSPKLAMIIGELMVALGGQEANVNIYLAPNNRHGTFPPHHDTVDTFIVQISGRKIWSLWNPVIVDPVWVMRNHEYEIDAMQPDSEVILEPGDVLFLRRGDPHRVRCHDVQPSLHVNLRCERTTGADFIAWLAQEAVESVAFRAGMPFDPYTPDNSPHRVAWIEGLLTAARKALENADAVALSNRFLDDRIGMASATGISSFPDLIPGSAAPLTHTSRVRLVSPLLRARLSGTTLVTLGQQVDLPERLVPTVAVLLSAPAGVNTVTSLAADSGCFIDEVLQLCEELRSLGVLRRV